MARLLLIRPPLVFAKSSYSVPLTMPLASAYLSANLLKHGHAVDNIDALGEGIDRGGISYAPHIRYRGLSNDDILARIHDKPQGIGVSVMFSQDWPHIESLLAALRRRFPDVPIIVGGEHPTAAGEFVLRTSPAVTHVARGEGEETIVEWADWIDGKRDLAEVAGIQYWGPGRVLTSTGPRARVAVPDSLPRPAWHLFRLEPYFAAGEGHGVERGRSMPLLATRGCPYECTFCSSPTMWTKRYVLRSPALVVDEIEQYGREYRATNVDFFDLTAIVRKSWILDFCAELKRRRLAITWQLPSGTRSEALDREALGEMASAGCTNITYAPESGSTRILALIKKKVNLSLLFSSIREAKKIGIFVKCNLIIGFPQERRTDIIATIGCALRFALMGVDDTGIYPFSPYPGSELYGYLRETGAIRAMDRGYFTSLMTFMGLGQSSHYCENVGPGELAAWRLFGMATFYFLSYALRPYRILRTLRNLFRGDSDTVFEERVFALMRRPGNSRDCIAAAEPIG